MNQERKANLLKETIILLNEELKRKNPVFKSYSDILIKLVRKYDSIEDINSLSSRNTNKKIKKTLTLLKKAMDKKGHLIKMGSSDELLKGYKEEEKIFIRKYIGYGFKDIIELLITVYKAYEIEKYYKYKESMKQREEQNVAEYNKNRNIPTKPATKEQKEKNVIKPQIEIKQDKVKKEDKLSPQEKQIIKLIVDVNVTNLKYIKDKNIPNISRTMYHKNLIELVYNYLMLSSKARPNANDLMILELYKKYDILKTIKKYEKELGEEFSYDNIINAVNTKIKIYIDNKYGYDRNYTYSTINCDNINGYELSRLTSLMDANEIKVLYYRYKSKLNENEPNYKINLSKLQNDFASAIQSNSSYMSYIKNVSNNDVRKIIERLLIVLEYFETLPQSIQSIDELYELIEKNIKNPKEKQQMYQIIYKFEEKNQKNKTR